MKIREKHVMLYEIVICIFRLSFTVVKKPRIRNANAIYNNV